jgi:hypothetical protein
LNKVKTAARAAFVELTSKEARPYEVALARLLAVALSAKLGYDFTKFVK